MDFWSLYAVALTPILKILLITVIGTLLALDRLNILGKNASKHINSIIYYVFTPALICSCLAKTITLRSLAMLWFMPINVLLTYMIGTALGWLLVKIIRVPHHLHGVVLGCCAAGNLASMPLIIVPTICKERSHPFGDQNVCSKNALAYASLSMAFGFIYAWSIAYNIIRVYSIKISNVVKADQPIAYQTSATEADPKNLPKCSTITLAIAEEKSQPNGHTDQLEIIECKVAHVQEKAPEKLQIMKHLKILAYKINLKVLIAPSSVAAIIGLMIGVVPQFRKLLIGESAPLHVVQDSSVMLGDASIPTVVLLVGANLLKGIKGLGKQLPLIVGIIVVKYIALPAIGICIVKGAVHFGFIQPDPLYLFVLLLQFAVPPAIVVSTVTQMFGVGEGECSVIMLAAYLCAAVTLPFWCSIFMWLVL